MPARVPVKSRGWPAGQLELLSGRGRLRPHPAIRRYLDVLHHNGLPQPRQSRARGLLPGTRRDPGQPRR